MTPPPAIILADATLKVPDAGGLRVSSRTAAKARDFAKASLAPRTREAYKAGWAHFAAWCQDHNAKPLQAAPATVACYLTELSDRMKPSTLALRVAAIAAAYRRAGLPSPTAAVEVRAVLSGIRRTVGVAQKQARPLLPAELRELVAKLPEGHQGARDRALLLLGFAGAFRRSELVGLNVGDLEFGEDGITVTIRRSKTDQEGQGRKVAVPYGSDKATCPVRAVKAWLELTGIDRGAIFRPVDRHGNVSSQRMSGQAVWFVVKRVAGSGFSGHSLRAGLVTAAAKAGKSAHSIMAQTGHKSVQMVARYIRAAELFDDNAASGIGL